MSKILIVEDDYELRRALTALLIASGYETAAYFEATAALAAVDREPIDLAIIDWNLSGMSGLGLLRQLRQQDRDLPILMLTARMELADRLLALDSGADDYLVKPFQMRELEARLRALLRRRNKHAAEPINVGPLTLVPGDPRVSVQGVPVDLPPRERAVLEMLARRGGNPVSKQVIVAKLSRDGGPLSESAIEIYVHRLRRRFKPVGLKIRTLRGFGYSLQPHRATQVD